MDGAGNVVVCTVCPFTLPAAQRKLSITIDDLVKKGGSCGRQVVLGYGVIVVCNEDPASTNLQGFVVNAHTSPFDLSVFGFEPQPILATSSAAAAKRFKYKTVRRTVPVGGS